MVTWNPEVKEIPRQQTEQVIESLKLESTGWSWGKVEPLKESESEESQSSSWGKRSLTDLGAALEETTLDVGDVRDSIVPSDNVIIP